MHLHHPDSSDGVVEHRRSCRSTSEPLFFQAFRIATAAAWHIFHEPRILTVARRRPHLGKAAQSEHSSRPRTSTFARPPLPFSPRILGSRHAEQILLRLHRRRRCEKLLVWKPLAADQLLTTMPPPSLLFFTSTHFVVIGLSDVFSQIASSEIN